MIRRLLFPAALAAVMFTASAASAERLDIRIGTGSLTGLYYGAGNAVCRVLERRFGRDVKCEIVESGGSGENLGLLKSGTVNFAIMQSDVLARHHEGGRGPSGIAALYQEIFQLVYRKNFRLTQADQVLGIRFNLGPASSGTRRTLNQLLNAFDLTEDDFVAPFELTAAEEATAFCNNEIDGFAFVSGVPSAKIAQVLRECDGAIVGFLRRSVGRFVGQHPGYSYFRFRKNAYEGMDRTVDTFAVSAVLVAGPDTPDGLVELVTESLLDDIDYFEALHPAWRELLGPDMATNMERAVMHPAAAAVYIDRAIIGE